MDVRAALTNMASFPLTSGQAEVIAIRRGLPLDEEFSTEVANSKAFELTYADILKMTVTAPNVSEGGVSISIADRNSLIAIANGIYSKWGEALIQEEHPTAEAIDDY